MNTLQLPSREAIREHILPNHPNTRWLYSKLVELCLTKGQQEVTLPQLKKIAGFDAMKSLWPMLQHLEEAHLIVMECLFYNTANQPIKLRVALYGQRVKPYPEKRIVPPEGEQLNCVNCGELIEVEHAQRHRKGWCLPCCRAYDRANKLARKARDEQERRYQASQQVAS